MQKNLVLIIEDDEPLADIFARALREAGFESELIHNGRLAMNRVREIVPALILLDLHLPEVNGTEILRNIQSTPALNDTRVIITTADPVLAESFREQVDLVLLKPISFTQLRDMTARMNPKA